MANNTKEPAIVVKNLTKEFIIPHKKHGSLKSLFVDFGRKGKADKRKVLNDISFEIKKGEFFGIIGRNGSGKSTLLKLLAGVYTPTKGAIGISGSLTPFIELGVGFNPELTGRENVFLNGALLGFSRKEMYAMYKDIVEFAELESFMDQKLKNYSSGMQVRLAFSIAIKAKSDILLVDEVLAVGDLAFQAKSFEVFRSLKKEGKTIIFVSHDLGSVKDFCTRAMVIEKGSLVFSGSAKNAVDYYIAQVTKKEQEEQNPYSLDKLSERITNGATISNGRIEDSKGKRIENVQNGSFTIKFDVKFKENAEQPNPGIVIINQHGLQISSANATWANIKTGSYKKGEKATFAFTFPNFLEAGYYKAMANLFYQDDERIYAWANDLVDFHCVRPFLTGSVTYAPYELSKNENKDDKVKTKA